MIVAIVNQTSPSGLKRVEEFRAAEDETAAVNDFCNGYIPPRNPASWLGYDTGWSVYQPPASGFHWEYNFDSPGLTQVANGDAFDWRGMVSIVQAAKAIVGAGFQDLGELSIDLGFVFEDITQGRLRVWGRYKSAFAGGTAPQLRLRSAGVDYAIADLADSGGNFVNFALLSNVSLPQGRVLFTLQGKLNAATSLEVMSTGIAMLEKKG